MTCRGFDSDSSIFVFYVMISSNSLGLLTVLCELVIYDGGDGSRVA